MRDEDAENSVMAELCQEEEVVHFEGIEYVGRGAKVENRSRQVVC